MDSNRLPHSQDVEDLTGGIRVAFIVKGPPSYINAEEAQYQAGLHPRQCTLYIVLPFLKAFRREERMEAVIDPGRWHSIHWITCHTKNKYRLDMNGNLKTMGKSPIGRVITHIFDAITIRWIATKHGPYELVYTAHNSFHEYLAYCFRPRQQVIVESGLSTIQRIEPSGYINYIERAEGYLRWIYLIVGFRIFDRQRTALFTSYGEIAKTKHQIIQNENNLKRVRCASLKIDQHIIWIGTPLCELHNYTSRFYIQLIRSGLKYCEESSMNMTYVPHPGKETLANIKAIRDELRCEVDDRLLPVEIKVARAASLPRAILTPFSSSLVNLEAILPLGVQLLSIWHPSFSNIPGLVTWRQKISNSGSMINFLDITDSL